MTRLFPLLLLASLAAYAADPDAGMPPPPSQKAARAKKADAAPVAAPQPASPAPYAASSYSRPAPGPRIGAKVGPLFSTYSVAPTVSTTTVNSKTGVAGGIFLELPFWGDLWSFQPEVHVATRGFNLLESGFNESLAWTALEIPLQAKVKFLPDSSFRPYLMFGPDFAFRLNESISATDPTSGAAIALDQQSLNTAETKTFEFGLDFAGGAAWAISPRAAILAEARFTLGLSDIYNGNPPQSGGSEKYRGFQLLVGMDFAY